MLTTFVLRDVSFEFTVLSKLIRIMYNFSISVG